MNTHGNSNNEMKAQNPRSICKGFWECFWDRITKVASLVTIFGITGTAIAIWQLKNTLTVKKELENHLEFAKEMFGAGERDGAYRAFLYLREKEELKNDTTGFVLFFDFAMKGPIDRYNLKRANLLHPTPGKNRASNQLKK